MPPSKIRFVTACQQLLALGLVVALLTPATGVLSLDIVRETPGSAGAGSPAQAGLTAYQRANAKPSLVPTAPVDATVTEVALTPPTASSTTVPNGVEGFAGRTKADLYAQRTEVLSAPQPVTGYGAVGVTWKHGVSVPETQLSFDVRTSKGSTWSGWMQLDWDAEHGPDPGSAEAQHSRPGSDALLVGNVDQVQLRARSTEGLVPPDLKMAVVDPGTPTSSAEETAAIDTADLDSATPSTETPTTEAPTTGTKESTSDAPGLALQAATYTRKPVIYSRAQWGADESMRDKSSLHYFEVHAGFVHHTVNANSYTRAEVPGIIRSIYAYHTRSRGWSDVGYNFLVDRFGRIWEGRAGGVDRPVVGAHTLGYNDDSFAMSAIGNYEITQPSAATVQAFGALFAWKLSLHGVSASSTRQYVTSRYFKAINGHRDAGQTACPGKYLYAQIPKIRTIAAAAQRGWAGRQLESNLASTVHPDLIVRRASDGQGFIIPTGGVSSFQKSTVLPGSWTGLRTIASPDLTGDKRPDVLAIAENGTATVRPGSATGFGAGIKSTRAFVGRDLVTAVGDLNGDGRNDFVARRTSVGRFNVYLGRGDGTFTVRGLDGSVTGYNLLSASGDLNGDGRADLLARDTAGRLWFYPGNGSGGFGARVARSTGYDAYDTITGFGDFTRDGKNDLFVRSRASGDGYLLPGRGNGTFGRALGPYPGVRGYTGVSGGGNLGGTAGSDLIARNGGRMVRLLNNGTFDLGAPIATGMDLRSANRLMKAGDWDRDGHGDVLTTTSAGALLLYRGNGTGTFAAPIRLATGFQNVELLAAVGDMNGDGWPDLMGQTRGSSGTMRIYPGQGVKGLRSSYVAHSRISATQQIAIGRFDADGAPDTLLRTGGSVRAYAGNGPGGLTGYRTLGANLAPYDWAIGVSDTGLTGHSDLIVREKSSGALYLLAGSTTGFASKRFLGDGMTGYNLAG